MGTYYTFVLLLLFILAISDLIVGVSNDAVNFLNSAIGSKVTSRRNIMIVASLGILVGATFSSGMMEVARKGVFNPEYFVFSEIMVLFIAVMITDIILLDLFNTFGLPTSTTVSIVFELLGAAVAISLLKISHTEATLHNLNDYINFSGAIIIISGIFFSVLIAFVVGGLVQYVSRLLFTFNIKNTHNTTLFVWSVCALSALGYFLLLKGISGASFIPSEFAQSVREHILQTFLISFIFWAVVLFLISRLLKVEILKVVVLFGTFALAMAFAGNDLVNFIGVPIAGLESYRAWSPSGVSPESYNMEILMAPVRSETYMLLIAGLIMILTLWFSKKARSVTETEVNLGRQNEGLERFQPNILSKRIVRYSLLFNDIIIHAFPKNWLNKAKARFKLKELNVNSTLANVTPAFDLVRASVNLTVASILIALATSFKLPLSTTYVSFMVAMGTSLADRAWGRNSAVYRIAGVLNVIGGWFMTALLAFSTSALFATFIYFFDLKAIIALLILAGVLITRTFILHSKKSKKKEADKEFDALTSTISSTEILVETSTNISETLQLVKNAYSEALSGLLKDDNLPLKSARSVIKQLQLKQEQLRRQLFKLIKRLGDQPARSGRLFILASDLEQDMVQSISLIVETSSEYVDNRLEPVNSEHRDALVLLKGHMDMYLNHLIKRIDGRTLGHIESHLNEKNMILNRVDKLLSDQIHNIRENGTSIRESSLILTILLETKDLAAVAARFAKLYQRISFE